MQKVSYSSHADHPPPPGNLAPANPPNRGRRAGGARGIAVRSAGDRRVPSRRRFGAGSPARSGGRRQRRLGRGSGGTLRRRNPGADPRAGSVVRRTARSVRAGLGAGRASSRPGDLCRSRIGEGDPRLFRRRPTAWRIGWRGRRSRSTGDDAVPAVAARSRNVRDDRHCDPTMATAGGGGRFRTADGQHHAMAHHGLAFGTVAGARHRSITMAGRVDTGTVGGMCGF